MPPELPPVAAAAFGAAAGAAAFGRAAGAARFGGDFRRRFFFDFGFDRFRFDRFSFFAGFGFAGFAGRAGHRSARAFAAVLEAVFAGGVLEGGER